MENNKDAIRLKTVKRVDQHVVSIVDCSMRTALYNYDDDEKTWSKTDIEGSFMLYTREAPPYNMLIIMNKLNKTDFIEALTADCDIQAQPPYLLFRNSEGSIFAIWFSEQGDVQRITDAIKEKINSEPQQKISNPNNNIMNDPAVGFAFGGSNKGDIMSMLSRAHGDFENKRQEPTSIVNTVSSTVGDLVKPSPLRAGESTTTNVADFFAKAGKSGIGKVNNPMYSPTSSTSGTLPINSSSSTNHVLQRLFQDAAAIGGQASVAPGTGVTAPISIPASAMKPNPHLSTSVASNAPMSLEELEGKLKENLHLSSGLKNDDQQLLKSPNATPCGTSLLSPQVFTTSHTPIAKLDFTSNPQGNLFMSGTCLDNKQMNNGLQESLHENVTPLTKEQLVQAFSILLKRDDFIHQLHEAYVQALNQSIKGCL